MTALGIWRVLAIGLACMWWMAAPAAAQSLSGPAARDIARHLGPGRTANLVSAHVFYGDYNGDGARDALAVIYEPNGGNSTDIEVLLFRNEGDGFAFVHRAEGVYGQNPRNVRFRPGRIDVTMTTLKPGEPRCCPTGTKVYTIEIQGVASARGEPAGATPRQEPPSGSGTLGRPWCDGYGGVVHFRGRVLDLTVGGDEMRFPDVEFLGCQGASCTYKQILAPFYAWTSTRHGETVTVRGPMVPMPGRLEVASATFGPCR